MQGRNGAGCGTEVVHKWRHARHPPARGWYTSVGMPPTLAPTCKWSDASAWQCERKGGGDVGVGLGGGDG